MTATDRADATPQDIPQLRRELASTLDSLEDALNVPRRVTLRLRALRREKPAVLAGAAAGAVVVIAAASWVAITAFRSR